MNERIKLLAEQAELNTTLLFNKDKLEKFAELIVKECIKAYNTDGYQTEHEQDLQVLEHFGINE